MPRITDVFGIAGVAGPLDVRIWPGPGRSPFAVQATNKVQRWASAIDLDMAIVQNLGISPVDLGVDQGLIFGYGLRVPARSQWSINGVGSIWSSPNYYDRNPLSIAFYVASGVVGPHAATVRWQYTVPANRRAFIESAFVLTEVWTPAGTPSDRVSAIAVFPGGAGGGTYFVLGYLSANQNVVGSRATDDRSSTKELQAGDIVQGITYDLGTGGSAAYLSSAALTEFDA